MRVSFIDAVRNEFEGGKEITLAEIYGRISKMPDLQRTMSEAET